MDLTKGGTVADELKDIPTRRWWKVTFAIPAILFLIIGLIDLFLSKGQSFQILLIGLMLTSSQLATSVLKKPTYQIGAQILTLIFALLFLYQIYFLR